MDTKHRTNRLLALLLAGLLAAAPALAQPPWAGGGEGNGKGNGGQKHGKSDDHGGGSGKGKNGGGKSPQQGAYFNDHNRQAVHTYYADAGRGGKSCPPGLAKKNNGCLPPGQAAKWNVGERLPTTVVTYPVPNQILIGLPPVPVGHKYVQVAGDILLVTVGSMMVVDGIRGLTR